MMKQIALFLALVLLLSCVGCTAQGRPEDTTAPETTAPTETETPTEAPTEAPTQAPETEAPTEVPETEAPTEPERHLEEILDMHFEIPVPEDVADRFTIDDTQYITDEGLVRLASFSERKSVEQAQADGMDIPTGLMYNFYATDRYGYELYEKDNSYYYLNLEPFARSRDDEVYFFIRFTSDLQTYRTGDIITQEDDQDWAYTFGQYRALELAFTVQYTLMYI